MTDPVAAAAGRLADRLPAADIETLAGACSAGGEGLARLRQRSASGVLRTACDQLAGLTADGHSGDRIAGALLGASVAVRHERNHRRVDAVWTGPPSSVQTSRLTSAVVVDLIAAARTEILLVSYATQSESSVAEALRKASSDNVDITLLLERTADNPRYSGHPNPFPSLVARRLSWPAAQRESGAASMHAKLLVIDRSVALVGSANVTGSALTANLECGLLVTDGSIPSRLHAHVDSLVERGHLVVLPARRLA